MIPSFEGVAGVRIEVADDHDHRNLCRGGEVADPADHFAVEALGVEVALTRDDDVGGSKAFVEVDVFGDEVEAREQPSTDSEQPAGQPAGGARAVDVADVDVELGHVALGQSLQAGVEQPDLGRRGPLLRCEHGGRVDESRPHVAGHLQVDRAQPRRAAERLDGAEATVGRRRASEPDEHGAGALLDRLGDQLAGAACRRRQRIVALGAASQGEPAGPGHLDHCRPAIEPPRASTRLPSGPVTTLVRLPPPNTSSIPSPPSDRGASSQSIPSSQHVAPPPRSLRRQ